jgi:hypothetical protein
MCVYICVVDNEECPNNSWTLFKSAPLLSKSVANVCLRAWGDILCFSAVSFTILSITNCTPLGDRCSPWLFISR